MLVYSYELDYQKSNKQRNALANNIMKVLKEKASSDIETGIVLFILFVSHETLLLPTLTKLIDNLIQIKMLNLICIDEVHLFIDFRLSFRRKFLNLHESLFNKIIKKQINNNMQRSSTHLIIPLLCITATFNPKLLYLLQQMTNI